MFSSLRTRLTFSHLAVIVLAMGLSGFLLLSFLESYFLQATKDSLLAQARITAQAVIPSTMAVESSTKVPPTSSALAPAFNTVQQQLSSNLSVQAENLALPADSRSLGGVDLTYLADASLQLSTQLTTRIRILDAQGSVLVDSGQVGRDRSSANLRNDPLVARALEGAYASRTDEVAGDTTMHLAYPAFVDERLVGIVYLSHPLSDVTDVLSDLRSRLLLSIGIGLLFSAVVGLLLSRAIASPLHRLVAAAGAVAQGQFNETVPVKSKDELGRLSRAFNDMTARLRAARQMQVGFIADVSHELRTPLTAVKGSVETLRGGAVEDPEVRDRFLETVENETDRLIRLVNDLLTLSRVDSEALNLRYEPVDLPGLIQDSVDRLASRALARGVVVEVKASPTVPLAWADRDRIEQVLVNLLDNAIKYSHSRGTVTVSVKAGHDEPQSTLVRVQDEGIGIPTADLPYIGQRFYRAEKARSRAEGGSGLGLAIARALVEAHGGRLWLESQESVGTTVSFTLPTP